jgi:hypothetical protein
MTAVSANAWEADMDAETTPTARGQDVSLPVHLRDKTFTAGTLGDTQTISKPQQGQAQSSVQ